MATDAFNGGLDGDSPAQGELDRAVAAARAAFEWRALVDQMSAEGIVDGVRATVAGSGGLQSLTVPTTACRDGGEAVAQRILEAVSAAQEDLAKKIRGSAVATFGPASHQVDTINASLATRFGLAKPHDGEV